MDGFINGAMLGYAVGGGLEEASPDEGCIPYKNEYYCPQKKYKSDAYIQVDSKEYYKHFEIKTPRHEPGYGVFIGLICMVVVALILEL